MAKDSKHKALEAKMTQKKWDSLSHLEREKVRDYSELHPQLKDFKGHRVEVEHPTEGKKRFIVGQTTGWKPWNIALHNRRSSGGSGISPKEIYKSVRSIRKEH